MDVEKARELLKKAKPVVRMGKKAYECARNPYIGGERSLSGLEQIGVEACTLLDQIISALDEPVCKKCGGSKKKHCDRCCGTGHLLAGAHSNKCFDCEGKGYIPCPDCQKPDEEVERIIKDG